MLEIYIDIFGFLIAYQRYNVLVQNIYILKLLFNYKKN